MFPGNFNIHSTLLSKTNTCIRSIEGALGNEGRVLVRYSGTENVARVMVEGTDQATIEEYAKTISKQMEAELAKG